MEAPDVDEYDAYPRVVRMSPSWFSLIRRYSDIVLNGLLPVAASIGGQLLYNPMSMLYETPLGCAP